MVGAITKALVGAGLAKGAGNEVSAIERALSRWSSVKPEYRPDALSSISFDPELRSLGSYSPNTKGIRLNPVLLGDDDHLLGTLSHELKHYTDDVIDEVPLQPQTYEAYWSLPQERRAFKDELQTVMDVLSRENRQPYLFPRQDIEQLVANQVDYGMDTEALHRALEFTPFHVNWQTLRPGPEQQKLPWD